MVLLLPKRFLSPTIINPKSSTDVAQKNSQLIDEEPSSLDSQATVLTPKRPLDETNNNPKKKVPT